MHLLTLHLKVSTMAILFIFLMAYGSQTKAAQNASGQITETFDPSNIVGIPWHCYSSRESFSSINYDDCTPAIEQMREDISVQKEAWLTPNQGTVYSWPTSSAKCIVKLGCTVPMTQGAFRRENIVDKLSFLKVICPTNGGKGYLPTRGVEDWSLSWYIEIFNPEPQPAVL